MRISNWEPLKAGGDATPEDAEGDPEAAEEDDEEEEE